MENQYEVIKDNLNTIKSKIKIAAEKSGRKYEDIKLLAATKTVPANLINYAIKQGINLIGENRVQELLDKYDDINHDNCDIHFIGHLQTNKVKQIIGKVSTIHSLDSIKLANEISKYSQKLGIVTNVLIQVNIGKEESKSGIYSEEVIDFAKKISTIKGINVQGLMTIPPISSSKTQNITYFKKIYQISIDISRENMDNINMNYLSMGMSSDYEDAIIQGSNIVRIGSSLFGKRK